MPIDTSFYNRTPPQAPNPLEMMSQMQGIQRGAMQNQLLQRTMAAQQARGQAYAANTDANGNVNTGGAMASMAQDPNATFGLDEAAQSNQALSQAQLTQHTQQIGMVNQILGSALKLATNPDGTPNAKALEGPSGDAIIKDVGNQLHDAGVPDAMIASQLKALPADGQGRYAMFTQHLVAGMQAAQQASAIYGQMISQSDGQTIHNTRMPDVAGAAPKNLEMQTPPTFDATPQVQTDNATGAQTYTTTGAIDNAPPGTIGAGQPTQIKATQAATGGAVGQLGAQAEAAFSHQRQQATQNAANFSLLRGDMGKMFTGAGAESRLALARAAQTAGIPVNADSITSTESAAKVLQQIINAQPNAGSSDKQLLSSITANPHLGLSADGLRLMSAVAEGNNNAQLAAGKAWDNAKSRGVGADQFNDRMPAIVSKLDPKVFQYEAAPTNLRHFITDGMSKAQLQQFHATLSEGMQKGWFK